jgi:hypothetical protein
MIIPNHVDEVAEERGEQPGGLYIVNFFFIIIKSFTFGKIPSLYSLNYICVIVLFFVSSFVNFVCHQSSFIILYVIVYNSIWHRFKFSMSSFIVLYVIVFNFLWHRF